MLQLVDNSPWTKEDMGRPGRVPGRGWNPLCIPSVLA